MGQITQTTAVLQRILDQLDEEGAFYFQDPGVPAQDDMRIIKDSVHMDFEIYDSGSWGPHSGIRIGNLGISEDCTVAGNIGIGTSPSSLLHTKGTTGEFLGENQYSINLRLESISETRYYLLGTVDELITNGHIQINGILAGRNQTHGRALINVMFSGETDFTVFGSVNGDFSSNDIVVYLDVDDIYYIYLKATDFAECNFNLTAVGTNATLDWDGAYITSTPTGSLHYTLSTDVGKILRVDEEGDMGLGTSSPDASALLELNSTTKGLLLPRMTSTQRDNISSPQVGLLLYEITRAELDMFTGGVDGWRTFIKTKPGTLTPGGITVADAGYDIVTYDGLSWDDNNKELNVGGNLVGSEAYKFYDGSTQIQAASPDAFRFFAETAMYREISFSIAEDANPFGLDFWGDGLTMYVIGRVGENVYEYDLDVPYDIDTAQYNSQFFNFTSVDDDPSGISVNSLINKAYIAGNQWDSIHEFDFGIPGKITSLSYVDSFDVSTWELTPRDVDVSPSGHKMYVVGTDSGSIHEFDLIRGELSTASHVQSLALSDSAPHGVEWKRDGYAFFISGNTTNSIIGHYLSTPWDISTVFRTQAVDVAAIDTSPTELFLTPDGSKIHFTGGEYDKVYELDLGLRIGGSVEVGSLTAGTDTLVTHERGRVTIGTSGIPIRGAAKLYITGPDDSFNEGGNFQMLTDADVYPLVELNTRKHDDITMFFDGYRDGNNYQSSDLGSNFGFRKTNDEFSIFYDSGVTPGSGMALNNALTVDTTGVVELGNHLYLADSKIARFGNGGDLQILHLSSGPINLIQSSNYDFILDNIKNDAQTIMRLGSDGPATSFQVQNNSEETLLDVGGSGLPVFTNTIYQNITEAVRSNPVDVYDITDPAQLLALATGTTITLTANTLFRINYAGTFISPVNFVTDGFYLDFECNNTLTYVYSNVGTMFTISGTGARIATAQIVAAVPGTQLFVISGSDPTTQYMQIFSSTFIGFNPGTMDFVTPLFRFVLFTDWTDTFQWTNIAAASILQLGSLKSDTTSTNKPLVSLETYDYAPGQGIDIAFAQSGGFVNPGETFIMIDPALHEDTRLLFSDTTLAGDLFDTSGASGAFTVVSNASITAESITSVSTVTGVPRFNYDGIPTVSVGQEAVINGFAIYTYYNGTWIITDVGAGWFEIGVLPFGGSEASGSFDSDSITVTATAHGLSEFDSVTLDTYMATDYDGGAKIYNVQTDSFQVNREWTATQTGTWSTEGLNQKDPRVLSTNHPSGTESRYYMAGYVNNNLTAVGTIVNNTFRTMEFGTLLESTDTERFKLIDSATGTFEYTGNEEITIKLSGDFTTVSAGGAQEFRFLWYVDKNTGTFVPIDNPNESMNELGSVAAATPLHSTITLQKGYKIRSQVTRTAGSSALTARYSTLTGSK